MSPLVFAVVLAAAALHATWNSLLKGSGSALMSTVLVSAWWTPGAPHPALPAGARPGELSLHRRLGPGAARLLFPAAGAYRAGDMSATYPLMRGAPPLLVALVSTAFLGETIGVTGWSGVILVSLGILSLLLVGASRAGWSLGAPATGFALLNALAIASYTLIDGVGVVSPAQSPTCPGCSWSPASC